MQVPVQGGENYCKRVFPWLIDHFVVHGKTVGYIDRVSVSYAFMITAIQVHLNK